MTTKVADQVPHEADLVRIESDGGLVENEEVWFMHHGVGESDPLTVTFGEAGDHFFFDILKTAKLEHIADAFP